MCLKHHSTVGHVFVQCSFDTVSSCFLITYCLTDTTCCLSYATDGNQIEPVCNSALVWTVWSSGRSDPKHRNGRPLPHQIQRPRLTAREKNHQKNRATEMKVLQRLGAKFHADVKTTSLRLDAHLATNAIFDMFRQMRSPEKSRRKVVRKYQLPY